MTGREGVLDRDMRSEIGWAAVITCFPTMLPSPTKPTVAVTTIPVQIDRRTIALTSAAANVAGTMKIGDPIWVRLQRQLYSPRLEVSLHMGSDGCVDRDRVAAFTNVVRHGDQQGEEARRGHQTQQ